MENKSLSAFVDSTFEDPAKTRPVTKQPSLGRRLSDAFKRLFDIVVALIGLILLAPLFGVVAILIRLDTPGPVFYRGRRVGRGGKEFLILKFRTMYEQPESYQGPAITARGDPRVTPLGKWLRETKINELPQLWNVLVGEMSLVGPRPEDPSIVARWSPATRQEILSVRPGITSPASVAYHDEERRLAAGSLMEDYLQHIQPDKMRLDRLYVRYRSFLTDLDALFWTLVILAPRLGERKIREGWLFSGPLSRLFRNHIGWFVFDFLSALTIISLLGVVWRLSIPLDVGWQRAAGLAMLLALLFSLFNVLLGVKMVSWSRAAAEDVFRLIAASGLVVLVQLGLKYFGLIHVSFPLAFVFTASLLVLGGYIIARYRLRLVTGIASRWIRYRRRGYGAGERILIVGAGEGGSFAAWLLRRDEFQRLYTVVGIVDDDPAKQGVRFEGFPVLGSTADIPALVEEWDIDTIFYAITKISIEDQARILRICHSTRRKVVVISDLLKSLHEHLRLGSSSSLAQSDYPVHKPGFQVEIS